MNSPLPPIGGISFDRRGRCPRFPDDLCTHGRPYTQNLLEYNFSVGVWLGYIDLFGIAAETGVVMVVQLDEALDHRLESGVPLRHEDIEASVMEGPSIA
jgi:copper/silver efflux system protein